MRFAVSILIQTKMKKTLLFLMMAIGQLTMAQMPVPFYKHSFTGTTTEPSFYISTTGITLTEDRLNTPNNAANLASSHGFLKLDISSRKAALMLEGTISMWFKYDGTGQGAFGNDKPLVYWSNGRSSYSEGLMLAKNNSNNLIKVVSYKDTQTGGAAHSSVDFPTSTEGWQHYTLTWKFGTNGFIRAYLNGSIVINRSHSHSLDDAVDFIYFTGFNDTQSSSLVGKIDEIYVFTQALTATQVYNVFQNGLANMCAVSIPDLNFKNALLNHIPVIDTNNNGIIECHEAEQFTDDLIITGKGITSLTGLEAFTGITYVNCSSNQIASANFGLNPSLTRIDCNANQLTSLDLTNNVALTALYCGENPFTEVDVSASRALNSFHATGSRNLTAINLKNGNNTNFIRMMVAGSNNLTCIQVDNPTYSTASWIGSEYNKPPNAAYSTNCNLSISDFETLKVKVYPNPTNGTVNISEAANITIFDIQGRKIAESKNTTSFDLSSQASGIYLAKITTEKGSETLKIVKK